MDWEDEPSRHQSDNDNQRLPFSYSTPLPASSWDNLAADALEDSFSKRLDFLLPLDPATGVATHEAACAYMDAMIALVSRHDQPLSLLSISVDDSPVLRFLGIEGAALIGRAVARCLRQETRAHDVVGHAHPDIAPDAFTFLVTCPLLNEEQAAGLGERLRQAMTAQGGDAERPWLTLSVGVATLSLEVTDSQSLVARSLEALRRARRGGGSRVWKHTDTRRALIEREDAMDAAEAFEESARREGREEDDEA